MTDRQGQGADPSTPSQWQGYFRNGAERVALWWVAHGVEVFLISALLLAMLAAFLGVMPEADWQQIFNAPVTRRRG